MNVTVQRGCPSKIPESVPIVRDERGGLGTCVFLLALSGLAFLAPLNPGLAPWAAFLRRFAAIELSSATWNKRCDECHSAARVSEQNSRIGAHCSRRTRRIGDLCFSLALSGLTSLAPLTQGLRPGLHSCAADPGLAPWAALLRRFAAIGLSSATWNKRCDECHSAARVSEQNSRIGAHCSRRTGRIGDLCFSFALSGLTSLAPLAQGLRPGLHSCAASRLSNCRAQHATKDVMNVTA